MRRLSIFSRPLFASSFLALLAPGGAPAADPWELLAGARDRLAAVPQVADFTQTFVPAGFSSGETESGSVALALPDLARWDYRQPFPRTFLVQGETVFTWNEGETSGRSFALSADEAHHLDLLRLDVGVLSRHYGATIARAGETDVEVRLVPSDGGPGLAEVSLTLRAADLLPTSLAYRDSEGNATRFTFVAFRPLAGTDVFLPPTDIEWLAP
ncbi:MAG: LolA family protein [Thermoanaerobaculia bacterium]